MQAPSIHTKAVSDEATAKARADSLLAPRFYTTDFAALEAIDVSPVRAEWDAVMAEYEGDNNHDHFQRDEAFAAEMSQGMASLSPEMRQEFLDFLRAIAVARSMSLPAPVVTSLGPKIISSATRPPNSMASWPSIHSLV